MKTKYAALCSFLLGSLALLAPPSAIAVPPRPLGDSKVLTAVLDVFVNDKAAKLFKNDDY